MGWLFMPSLAPHSGPRQYLDAQFTYERPDLRARVLRSALVATRTYYAAVEFVPAGGQREVTALVCLVRYHPRDRRGYVFGYKGMDESVGPFEADCPAHILDLLTPTDRPHAVDWRARCRANLARRTARPRLRAGQTVVFDAPLTFSDGARRDRFEVVIDPERPRAIRFRDLESGKLCRISRLAAHSYRVVG